MPFIDLKVSKKVSEDQKDALKRRLGDAITTLHKPESYLMIGIADSYSLYFSGKKMEEGAFVAVDLFGRVTGADSNKMTGCICKILEEELGILPDKVYVRYIGVENWGYNGANF